MRQKAPEKAGPDFAGYRFILRPERLIQQGRIR
jgi:hypothetical protein